jgi:formylglycine-generating enzyme required for sulfatase activity/serine/threonine protein kinase
LPGKGCTCPHCHQPLEGPVLSPAVVRGSAFATVPSAVHRAERVALPPEPLSTNHSSTPTAEHEGEHTSSPHAADYAEMIAQLHPPEEPGELGRLGGHRILEVLGAGAMGIVYQAEDPLLQRRVALKAMLPKLASCDLNRQRFLREAQAAASVEHDHIITIHQVGQDGEIPYLTMAFLKGETLEALVEREHILPLPLALRIAREMAEGLQAAHEQGLVHRDVKPANVFLEGSRSRVKLLDFGLVRPVNGNEQLTMVGDIVGTPAYMAPEQAWGKEVDPRTDLFSLGCVLYRMLGGQTPFLGNSALDTLVSLVSDESIPLRQLNPQVPEEVETLVSWLLIKDLEGRPGSAQEVSEILWGLEQAVAPASASAEPPVSPSTNSAGDPAMLVPVTPGSEGSGVSYPPLADLTVAARENQATPAAPGPAEGQGREGRATMIPTPGEQKLSWLSLGEIESPEVAVVSPSLAEQERTETTSTQPSGSPGGPPSLPDHQSESQEAQAPPSRGRVLVLRGLVGLAAFTVVLLVLGLVKNLASSPENTEPGEQGPNQTGRIPESLLLRGLGRKESDAGIPRNGARPNNPISTLPHRGTEEKPPDPLPSGRGEPGSAVSEPDGADAVPPITNSIGMKLVWVAEGKFTMGSPREEKERGGDESLHEVEISKPFYMGAHEVTQEQYERVMGHNPSAFSATGSSKDAVRGMDTRSFPVEGVSWDDAMEFCGKLSALPEEKQAGRVYRLPTEAEWEYACRGGPVSSGTPFHFGDTLSSHQANFIGDQPYGAPKGPNLARTTRVGSYPCNGLGLYDMHGNVWEWCESWYGTYPPGPVSDPTGPATGTYRVLRGGSWLSGGCSCRSALRSHLMPGGRVNNIGFRVVVRVDPR